MTDDRRVIVGRWVDFIREHEKVGLIIVENEFKGKIKRFAFKVFNSKNNPDNVNSLEDAFNRAKGQEVKVNYGLSEMGEWKDKFYPSNAICWNIEPAGADPEPVLEQPTIEREPVVDLEDDDPDLPF